MNVSAQNWTRILNRSERSHQFRCRSDPTCSQLNQLLLLCGKPAELLNQLQPGSITAGVLLPSAATQVQPLSRTTRSDTRPVNPPEPSCWTFTLNQRCRLNRVLTGSDSDKNPPADQNQVDSGSDPHSLQKATEQINTEITSTANQVKLSQQICVLIGRFTSETRKNRTNNLPGISSSWKPGK